MKKNRKKIKIDQSRPSSASREAGDMSESREVRRQEVSFGTMYQLWQGNMLMDTYCPWNGDERPDWMDLYDEET